VSRPPLTGLACEEVPNGKADGLSVATSWCVIRGPAEERSEGLSAALRSVFEIIKRSEVFYKLVIDFLLFFERIAFI